MDRATCCAETGHLPNLVLVLHFLPANAAVSDTNQNPTARMLDQIVCPKNFTDSQIYLKLIPVFLKLFCNNFLL